MRALLVVFVMMVALAAEEEYPKFYASMGDPLYRNAKGYRALLESEYFQDEHDAIRSFVLLSEQTRHNGLAMDTTSSSAERINYMDDLRYLKIRDEALATKLQWRLEKLFKAGKYRYLSSLQNSSADTIKNAKVVKTSIALLRPKQNPNASEVLQSETEEVSDFVTIQRRFNAYKKALLRSREEGNATACLNDITALYHFFLRIEMANDQKNCYRADEAYEQMKGYLHQILFTCKDEKMTDVMEAKATSQRYDIRNCEPSE